MHGNRRACAALGLALLAAAPLALADEPVLKGGERELEVAGSITESSTEFVGGGKVDASLVTVTLRHGWFRSAENEVGVLGSLNRIDNGSAFTFGQVGIFYDRNFVSPDSRTVPVAGVSAQALFGDVSGHVLEASAGLRVFGSDDVSVNWRAFYSFTDADASGLEQEITNFGVRVGLSWIIR